MADIKIIVDTSSLVDAKKKLTAFQSQMGKTNSILGLTRSLKGVESNIQELIKAQSKGSLSARSFKQGLLEQRKALEVLGLSSYKAKQAVDQFNAALRNQAAAQAAAKAARTVADANRRLRMEFKEGYAAQVQLRAAQMRLNQARRQGIITDEEYTRQLARLGDVTRQSSQHMSRSGVAMQQVGYQVGDFIVQVQSGQNPMVAFGQQATQMVGALYMLPPAMLAGRVAILGMSVSVGLLIASLGIIIPLATAIGAALMRMKKNKDSAGKAASSLDEKLKSLKTTLQDYADTLTAMRAGVSLDELFATRGVGAAKDALAAAKKELETYQDITDSLNGMLGITVDLIEYTKSLWGADKATAYSAAVKAVTDAEKVLADLRKKEADTRASNFAEALRDITQETALLRIQAKFGEDSEQAINAALAQETLNRKAAIDARVIAGELDAAAAATLKQQIDLQEELKLEIEYTAQATQEFLDKLFSIDFSDAISGANTLANEMSRAAGNAWDFMVANTKRIDAGRKLPLDNLAAQYSQYGAGRKAFDEEASSKRYSADSTYDGFETSIPKATKTKGGGKSPQEELAEFLTKKKEEAALEAQLIGLFDEERGIQSELIKFKQDYGKVASEAQTAEYTATVQQMAADKERQKVLEEVKQQQEQLADYVANSMGDALMSVVDGTMSVKDAFKSMAADIIKELYRVLVVQQMVNAAKGFMGFFADGGVISGGSQVQAYANGGVVGGPTTFPMAGGKTGLMGEAGPEAIMPLKRGANGKLGVQMEGGGGDTIVVNQSFNFQANGDATIKQLIAQAAPKIAQMTKSSLLDDRRRGGSTKAAFG